MEVNVSLKAKLRSLGEVVREDESADQMVQRIVPHFLTEESLLQRGFMLIGADGSEQADEWLARSHDYILEPKIDEIRMQMYFHLGRVRFQVRGRAIDTYLYGERSDNYPQYHNRYDESLEGTILDGGMVFGLSSRNKKKLWMDNDLFMMISINGSLPERAVELQRNQGWARYIVFDILRFKHKWIVDWPFEKRRVLAEVIAEDLELDIVSQQLRGFKSIYQYIIETGGEGVVLKRKGHQYQFDRSQDWVRVKRYDDLVGWIGKNCTQGAGRIRGVIGSVEIVDENGKEIVYIGALDDELREKMSVRDGYDPEIIRLNNEYIGRQVLIRHNGKTGRGGLRHARIIKWASEGQDLRRDR